MTAEKFKANKSPVYLIIADETTDAEVALAYAVSTAKASNAKVAVVSICNDEEAVFMPWSAVSDQLEAEREAQICKRLNYFKEVLESQHVPAISYCKKGKAIEQIESILEEDTSITELVLVADMETGSPGPLVNYFSGQGLKKLPVPLVVIPSNLDLSRAPNQE